MNSAMLADNSDLCLPPHPTIYLGYQSLLVLASSNSSSQKKTDRKAHRESDSHEIASVSSVDSMPVARCPRVLNDDLKTNRRSYCPNQFAVMYLINVNPIKSSCPHTTLRHTHMCTASSRHPNVHKIIFTSNCWQERGWRWTRLAISQRMCGAITVPINHRHWVTAALFSFVVKVMK